MVLILGETVPEGCDDGVLRVDNVELWERGDYKFAFGVQQRFYGEDLYVLDCLYGNPFNQYTEDKRSRITELPYTRTRLEMALRGLWYKPKKFVFVPRMLMQIKRKGERFYVLDAVENVIVQRLS